MAVRIPTFITQHVAPSCRNKFLSCLSPLWTGRHEAKPTYQKTYYYNAQGHSSVLHYNKNTIVPCTLGWPYTECTWLYCDYFIWCVSCTVVVWTGFVMCGCSGNVCTCIYCVFVLFVLCFLYCFVYVYLLIFVLSVLV